MSKTLPTPGDEGIRTALLTRLSKKHASDAETVIIEELGLCRGKVRVDVAVVNGTLHGYEIKSDRDTLNRLTNQAHIYGKVLDRATIVVGESHLEKAKAIVPEWWEIICVQLTKRNLKLKTLRRGRKNPDRDPRSLVELLWYEDALALLEKRNIARGFRGKPRWMLWDRICEYFSASEIASAVRAKLKARVANQVLPQPCVHDG